MAQRHRSTDAALLPSVRRRHPRRSSGAPYLEPLRQHRRPSHLRAGQRLATASVEPLDDRPRSLGRPPSLPPLTLDDADTASPAHSGESRELVEMKKQVEELQNSLTAATARAEVAERKLAARASAPVGPTDMEQRLLVRNWRLGSQLAASKRRSSPRPQPPPPPAGVVDPAAGLIDWLAAGGTDQLCSVAAKTAAETIRLCGHGLSDTGRIQSAFAAAAAAAAQEVCGVDTIKAALEAAAANLTAAIGLRPTSSAGSAVESGLNRISNLQAREWWRGYIGERHSVRSQSVIAAFAAWFLKNGLSEAEAQIFGALAVYGIDADEDGDITVAEFNAFTKSMGSDFTVAAVRSCEVSRDDPDAGSVDEFAQYLGINPATEAHLMWIAEHCRTVPLPRGWVELVTEDGDSYFHHAERGETTWHHPLDPYFKQIVVANRKKGAR